MCFRKILIVVFLFSLMGISGSYAQKIQLDEDYLVSQFFKENDYDICYKASLHYEKELKYVHKIVKYETDMLVLMNPFYQSKINYIKESVRRNLDCTTNNENSLFFERSIVLIVHKVCS